MIYTAPRQVLFAVIIVTSFFLHTLLLVFSTEAQIAESREQKAERIIVDLIDEAAVSMSYKDRVSLSVIAKKYAGEYDVTRLVILDNNEDVLMQTGDAPLQEGMTIREIATYKDSVVGSVLLTMKNTNKSDITKDLWFFIVSSFFFHLFIWMLYSLVARPTKQQIKMLSNDIHEHYFSHYHAESLKNQGSELLAYNPSTPTIADARPKAIAQQTINDQTLHHDQALQQQAQIADDSEQSDTLEGQVEATDVDESNTDLDTTATKKTKKQKKVKNKKPKKAKGNVFANIRNKFKKNKDDVQPADADANKPKTKKLKALANPFAAKTAQIESDNDLTADTEIPSVDKPTMNQDIASFIAKNNNNEATITAEDLLGSDTTTNNKDSADADELSLKPTYTSAKNSASDTNVSDSIKNNIPSGLQTPAKNADSTDNNSGIVTNQQKVKQLLLTVSFVDPYGLIDKLSDEISIPYYKLCTQLLNQACRELFKQEFLQDVRVSVGPHFSKRGAKLMLTAEDEKALVLAGPVLAELYQILNNILYEKHRELGKFSLPVVVGVTIPENIEYLNKFTENFTEAQDIVLLLPKRTLGYLKDSMNFTSISHPRTLLERECIYVDEVNADIQKMLFNVRNNVLKGKQTK